MSSQRLAGGSNFTGSKGMFDAAQRRVCQVRTVRTNSPMHALNLLNDTTYVEAAKALAIKVSEKHQQPEDQIVAAF